ncbi:sensor domain-containing diguanylate cyclase [Vibrio pacinii]|uniref:sensor domain-containing diguanylate cyclase n=1 Tax=Vibrio pacinii TaxID=170674 RepID=UPI00056F18C5|nr:sensor domain-containing diguanylate cyclase [Vibrio pacinii]
MDLFEECMPSHEKLIQVINIQSEIVKLGLDLGMIMQFVVERTLSLVDSDGAVIELAEQDAMVYRAASGIAAKSLGLRLSIGSSLSGMCITSGEILTCPDSEMDTRVDKAACRKMGIRAMVVLPLTYQGKTIGVLKAASSQAHKFTQPDIFLLDKLAIMVAAMMSLCEKYDRDALFIKATHDDMTGLANRALFMDRFRTTVAQCQKFDQQSAVVISDLDGLKKINDNHGHRAGDAVIKEFAQRVQQVTDVSNTVARLGGDEFGVILSPINQVKDVETFVYNLESNLVAPLHFENQTIKLNTSCGYALIPSDGLEIDNLIDLADKRMYAAKRLRYTKHKTQRH